MRPRRRWEGRYTGRPCGRWAWPALCTVLPLLASGCGGDARVELSAADALTAVAAQMRVALDEYHAEVETADDARESAVTRAFVERVRQDAADAARLDQHALAFEEALRRVRADRRTEWQRRTAAQSQVEAVLEVARGLRRIGIEGLTLQDEVKRYLGTLLERRSDEAASRGSSDGRQAVGGGG